MGVPRNATEAAALLGVPVDAAEGVVEERRAGRRADRPRCAVVAARRRREEGERTNP